MIARLPAPPGWRSLALMDGGVTMAAEAATGPEAGPEATATGDLPRLGRRLSVGRVLRSAVQGAALRVRRAGDWIGQHRTDLLNTALPIIAGGMIVAATAPAGLFFAATGGAFIALRGAHMAGMATRPQAYGQFLGRLGLKPDHVAAGLGLAATLTLGAESVIGLANGGNPGMLTANALFFAANAAAYLPANISGLIGAARKLRVGKVRGSTLVGASLSGQARTVTAGAGLLIAAGAAMIGGGAVTSGALTMGAGTASLADALHFRGQVDGGFRARIEKLGGWLKRRLGRARPDPSPAQQQPDNPGRGGHRHGGFRTPV